MLGAVLFGRNPPLLSPRWWRPPRDFCLIPPLFFPCSLAFVTLLCGAMASQELLLFSERGPSHFLSLFSDCFPPLKKTVVPGPFFPLPLLLTTISFYGAAIFDPLSFGPASHLGAVPPLRNSQVLYSFSSHISINHGYHRLYGIFRPSLEETPSKDGKDPPALIRSFLYISLILRFFFSIFLTKSLFF